MLWKNFHTNSKATKSSHMCVHAIWCYIILLLNNSSLCHGRLPCQDRPSVDSWDDGDGGRWTTHNGSSNECAGATQCLSHNESCTGTGIGGSVGWHKTQPPTLIKDISNCNDTSHVALTSFLLWLGDRRKLPSVNKSTEKSMPVGAINQLGHSLKCIIHIFAAADENHKVIEAKFDIMNGFWRMDAEVGEE